MNESVDQPEKPLLLFVVGPTASGKSDLAIEICERARDVQPEIINCDSIQFFKGVEIGAAKPSAQDLARVPHHLISHVALGGDYNAGDFRRDALRVIEGCRTKRLIPVGGSGFYVQALEKGMYEVPEIPDLVRESLMAEMEAAGPAKLHEELRKRDPEAAKKIQPADRYRILRALEILRSAPEGKTLSGIRAEFEAAKPPAPFRVIKMGLTLSRDKLRERVERRTRKMLEMGLIDEVKGLRAQGLRDWAPLSSVGYKETQSFLDGGLTRAELEPLIVTSTMQLAKRQMTWFKRDPEIRWFDVNTEMAAAAEFAMRALET